ncbi:hypothetical protein P692DRAFT_20738190 [Suillus brevipes Sb2]|nr:hypothetical protein P692DRAFT_20738190 [Suillus brevipes Sb2]
MHGDHKHRSRTRNHRGTYLLSTGEQQRGMGIISMAWAEDYKPSRHLPSVNRRAAARHGDLKHGSRTTNYRGTYNLSTGEQQQGMGIISMDRGPKTIEALTSYQQASSSEAWGS